MVMELVLELFFTASLSFCLAFLFVKFVSSVGAPEGVLEQEKCCVSSVIPRTEHVHIEDHVTSLEDKDEVVLMQEEEEEEGKRLVDHELESDTKAFEYVQEEEVEVEVFPRCEENLVDQERSTPSSSSSSNESHELTLLEKQEEVVTKLEDKTGEVEEEEEDDDWEGIERSEVEKMFGCASKFVDSSVGKKLVSQLSNEVQKQLYGLHRVAIEGPCQGMPPMALMIAARAKWHAWQQLGNMTPEVAMEQYVNLLSRVIPDWVEKNNEHDTEQDEGNSGAGESETNTDENLSIHHTPNLTSERKPEEPQSCESCDAKSL